MNRLSTTALGMGILLSATSSVASAATLDEQRKLYDDAQALLDMRQVERYQVLRPQIANYPLTPYVDYRAFLVGLSERSSKEVDQFISDYRDFPFSTRIRAPYLDGLAKKGRWQEWLTFQSSLPNGERYQCHYYWAHLKQGRAEDAYRGAKDLWQSGSSVNDACDPLFKAWSDSGERTDLDILQRMVLAFEARNVSLMSYLSKQVKGGREKQQAQRMLELNKKPLSVVSFSQQNEATVFNQHQAVIALKKLARSEVGEVPSTLNALKSGFLSPEQQQEVRNFAAFRLMNTDDSELTRWRDDAIAQTSNEKLIERRVRLAIGTADWQGVMDWSRRLTDDNQSSLRWAYWQARANHELGQEQLAGTQMKSLLGQRNFYSVAAAVALDKEYQYTTSQVTLDKSQLTPFNSALVRIEELIKRDKIAAAKSEWRFLLNRASQEQKEMLAAYAGTKRWHHLTVTATIAGKMWDNTLLRFPTAHKWWFNFYAERHNLDLITLLSLARQESALDVDARSPVGARGIMQIMPATAEHTAKKYGISYQNSDQLYDVQKNIEIGSQYLKSLMTQYDNNRIFSLAAYNAGPGRVKQWRERSDNQLDVFAFIESIPFYETRGYVQNILMFETYYRSNLDQPNGFLTEQELNARY
ncbi:murein transglycosylase [Vibrio astriarenae]|uniref:Murein transglycosylase n=1 Tax=Vibrio astriarenae TaxID=1481923 RepID=A0A7Z2YCY0_9VIBR|nr:murein transglycosylase [Vibrio astriarenae]QIA62554.1 murein transglycosylase [Vibrio astriarenae]